MLSRSCLAQERGTWKSSFDIIRTGKSPLNGQLCAEKSHQVGLKQKMSTCSRQRQRAASSRGLRQGGRRDERGMGEGTERVLRGVGGVERSQS